ncbi:hypothetical protein D3C71_343980 [compost metagenome]
MTTEHLKFKLIDDRIYLLELQSKCIANKRLKEAKRLSSICQNLEYFDMLYDELTKENKLIKQERNKFNGESLQFKLKINELNLIIEEYKLSEKS